MSHTAARTVGAETESWVRSAFDLLVELPGAHRVGVALVEAGGRRLSFTSSDRQNDGGARWCEIDAYEDVPLNNTIRSGRLISGSLRDLAGRYPDFVDRQSTVQALATVPLSAAGQILGGFAIYYEPRQPFDETQLGELRRLGDRLGADLRHRLLARRTRLSVTDEPAPPGLCVATRVLDPDLREVPVARRFARDTLVAWGITGDALDSALLCLSELVTNALIHTVAGCQVRVALDDGVLTIGVRDAGTGSRNPASPTVEPLTVHGRGLNLVDALCTRWGYELAPVGMTVWCELEAS